MIPALSLWLPVILSAVFVFIVSSIIHMVLTYHSTDFKGVPSEDEVMKALRVFKIPPGEYFMPHVTRLKDRETPVFEEKMKNGPVAFLTVVPGDYGMGKSLLLWFLYSVLCGLFAAYLAGLALDPGARFMEVFRFTGAAAFGAYSLALLQNSIWYKRAWSTTLKSMGDGFLYALVTAATFGWLWPAA